MLLELNPKKLAEPVADAEAAMFKRLQGLSNGQGAQAERQAIQDAINALKVIKRDNLKFPDWDQRSSHCSSGYLAGLTSVNTPQFTSKNGDFHDCRKSWTN